MVDWSSQLLRTLLFAPGNQPRKVARVADFGADAIVLDLEDAVAEAEKEAARTAIRAAIPGYRKTVVMVRINGWATGRAAEDLRAIVCPDLHAVLLPKAEDAATLGAVDQLLAVLEAREGLPTDTIRLFPLIETARGIARVEEIAFSAPRRVHTLIFGLADFATDLGIDLTPDGSELLYARSRVVIAARAAGLAPPIDGPYLLNLHDRDGLLADSRRSRQLGFQGRVVVYPPQVEPTNWAFSYVSPDEVTRAREIVQQFEAAEATGSAAIRVGGKFVDYPIYRRALQTLRLHDAASQAAEHPPTR